jgi:hypothetical protein
VNLKVVDPDEQLARSIDCCTCGVSLTGEFIACMNERFVTHPDE